MKNLLFIFALAFNVLIIGYMIYLYLSGAGQQSENLSFYTDALVLEALAFSN